jgi:hypothetical protein
MCGSICSKVSACAKVDFTPMAICASYARNTKNHFQEPMDEKAAFACLGTQKFPVALALRVNF